MIESRRTRLKWHARIQGGLALSGAGNSAHNEWPFLRVANVQAGRVDTSVIASARFSDRDAARALLRVGDVLMTEGGDIDKLGRGALWDGRIDPCLHQNHVFAVRPDRTLDSSYLTYVLSGNSARSYFRRTARKTTNLASTSKYLVGNLPIWLPGIHEQQELVRHLNDRTTRIRELIVKQRSLILALHERRAAAVQNVLDGAGGRESKLKYHAHTQTGVTIGGGGAVDRPEWPYLRVANVQAGYVDTSVVKTVQASAVEAAGAMLLENDVLVTEGGDIDQLGRGSIWDARISPCLHQNHIFALRPGVDLNPSYLVSVLDGSRARDYFRLTAKKTTNLASTNKSTVGNLPITVPPVHVQRDLLAEIGRRTSRVDELIGKAHRFVQLAQERQAALITAAVTGQIDVRGVA